MRIHIHTLSGCRPVPLGHYLKALGILRLVSEQKDPSARGWWNDDSFSLATELDEASLRRFFLKEYSPTPLVAPWNGGSGFYPRDNNSALEAIEHSESERFAVYREAIASGRLVTHGLEVRPTGEAKNALLRECRKSWRGTLLRWFEAAVVLDASGEPAYPALLGTGGNDGRLDFTNNFMQRLVELIDPEDAAAPPTPFVASALEAALIEEPRMALESNSVGQFIPGGAGGANSGAGFTGASLVNPWDFVLMFEGAVVFTPSIVRRARAAALPQAAAPFAVRGSAAGYGSAADADLSSRGEQWLPLWDKPATVTELELLIAEGRSQIGDRVAGRTLDFGRAVARLGIARGITGFERYGFMERNGQSNLAVPLGRWNVSEQPHQELLDEVAGWVDRLRRAGRDKNAPASITRAARACDEAMLACCRDGANPSRWRDLLIILGAAEAQLPRSPRFTAEKRLQPLPRLGAGWVGAAYDGSAEFRLALAFACQVGHNEFVRPKDPIRRHFLPLDPKKPGRFHTTAEGLGTDSGIVCTGADLMTISLALVRRRIVEASQSGSRSLPLIGKPGTEVSLGDIGLLLESRIDEARTLGLARPFMAMARSLMSLDTNSVRKLVPRTERDGHERSDAFGCYGVFRLAHWPESLEPKPGAPRVPIPLDPSIFVRLASGDTAGAFATAASRLATTGLRPHIRHAVGTPELARRLALSLAFPITARDATALATRLTRPKLDKKNREPDLIITPTAEGTSTP